MKYFIDKIEIVQADSRILKIQGWIISQKCGAENIKIITGENYRIIRVDRQDVAVHYGLREEDYRCGFEIYIEQPHNYQGYTVEIDDNYEKLTFGINVVDYLDSKLEQEQDKKDSEDRKSAINFYDGDAIIYNIEMIFYNTGTNDIVIKGWEFSKESGQSFIKINEENKLIKCSRKDVLDYYKESNYRINEICGFEIYISNIDNGIDIVFDEDKNKVVLHYDSDYLKSSSKYVEPALHNKYIELFKKKRANKLEIAKYGLKGVEFKQFERRVNLEEDGLNRTTYQYERVNIPVAWTNIQKRQPQIDIIIAVKNVEQKKKYIQRLADCLKRQKYNKFKVVFVGSDKDINCLKITDVNYNILCDNSSNKLELYDFALKNTDAEYFTFINQEDYIEEDYLSSYIERINTNPEEELFYENFDIDLKGELIFPIERKNNYTFENLEFMIMATVFSRKIFKSIGEIRRLCKCEYDEKRYLHIDRVYYHYEMTDDAFDAQKHSKPIAFYLPQFHINEENNKWWGEGFTEWTNVRRGEPMFEGHNQPRIPSDLGYYDLVEDKSVAYKQIELAKKYGVYGFCFYYYWFAGKRLLRKPFDLFVENKDLKFPFCICWANETWSRRWNGDEKEVLMKQVHNPRTDKKFIQSILPLFRDDRYIKIDGKPLLLIYRIELFPRPAQTINKWRELCKKEGIGDIHIALVQSFGMIDHRIYGGDSAVEFPPHKIQATQINDRVEGLINNHEGKIYSYEEVVKNQMIVQKREYTLYPGSMLGWDNTARRMNAANVFHGYRPELFEQWLVKNQMYTRIYNSDPVMFINAWNEWAEGTYLEPDQKFGTKALEVVNEVTSFK